MQKYVGESEQRIRHQEAVAPDLRAPPYEALAHHFGEGVSHDKAVDYALLAAFREIRL